MSIDKNDLPAATNCVVFETKNTTGVQRYVKHGPTLADDGIKSAWLQIKQENGLSESDVAAIYSEWQHSEQDANYIEDNFPEATVTFSFERPEPDQWDEAIKQASETILQTQSENTANEAMQDVCVLPVLRTFTEGGVIESTGISIEVTQGLAVFLARTGTKRNKTVQCLEYILQSELKDGVLNEEELWAEGFTNLVQGLHMNSLKAPDGEFIMLDREGGFAAAALALTDLPQNAMGWVRSPKIIFGVPDANTLLIGAADAAGSKHIREVISRMGSAGETIGLLSPCLLELENDEFRMLS